MSRYKIDWVEQKTTSTGKTYKKATITGADGTHDVSVWPDYASYEAVTPGSEVEGVVSVNGKFKNLVAGNLGAKPSGFTPRAPAGSAKAQETKRIDIQNAQENKGEAIKLASTLRDAVLVALAELGGNHDHEEYKSRIRHWREWLYAEWDNVKDAPPFNS